ncbi:hypothetical protein VTK56DRAFT_8355 [Thermocarpiscus australiensis]
MPTQPSARAVAFQRPVPTPETQELYNKWRQEDEKPSLERIEQQGESDGFLCPLSPSQATARSRSPSCASTTHSVTHAMNAIGVSGDQLQTSRARSGRHGPLPQAKRLKAALIRKLGACDDCRGRRVTCKHFDFSLFEVAYQAAKTASARPPSPDLDSKTSAAAPYRPRFSDSSDLIGVEENPVNLLSQTFLSGRDDLEMLSNQAEAQQTVVRPNSQASPLCKVGDARAATSSAGSQSSFGLMTQDHTATNIERRIPIGRQVTPYGHEWECMWGGGDETDSSVSICELEPCNRRCSTVEALKTHFTSFHGPFWDADYMWQCTICGFQWISPHGPCFYCSEPSSRQAWCFAKVSIPPRSTSRPSVRVPNGDASNVNLSASGTHSARVYGPAGGHNVPSSSSYGATWNPSGAGQSSRAAKANALRGSSQAKDHCMKAALAACHYGDNLDHDRRRLACRQTLNSDTISKAAWFGHAHAAFPRFLSAILIVSFLALGGLIKTWESAGQVCAGYERFAYCIADNARIRITDLSVACIAAGSLVAWLFRHVRRRLNERLEAPQNERCYMRDVLGIPDLNEAGSVRQFPADHEGLVGNQAQVLVDT